MAQISDLLDIIHLTIINKYGENNSILEELQSIDEKIKSGKLENLSVTDTTFFQSLVYNENKIAEFNWKK